MKIYLNRQPVEGPWGGGNHTVINLGNRLMESGHQVVFHLEDKIDVIFCFDPRPNNYGEEYRHFINYKNQYGTKIVQRVGDLGTHNKPRLTELVRWSIQLSDFVVFPSEWAKEHINYKKFNYKIIKNCPPSIFGGNRRANSAVEKNLKIVTHHWSMNEKKGFNFYSDLGALIKSGKLENIKFTYIGRYNDKFSKQGIEYIKPKNSYELSNILPHHDVYLTASIEEAGANHVLEAMAAGLPVIYRANGGSIEEYCSDYGIKYGNSIDSLLEAITSFRNDSADYYEKVAKYNHSASDAISRYEKIICSI